MLDKNKPFGLCGTNNYGKRYYQDKKFFNDLGEEVTTSGKLITQPELIEKEVIKKPRKKRTKKVNTDTKKD